MYENPNLIPRILRQESPVIPLFKSHSCPIVFEFLEDIEFDDQFELSLFETKSKSAIGSTVINPKFIKYLKIEQANRSIDSYILNIQNSIVATNIPEFIESASETLGPSKVTSGSQVHTEPSFIPTIPVQPSTSDQQSAVVSPPFPPHTPHTSTAPTPPVSPRQIINPPRSMAARFAHLVLPQNLDPMPADYQSKIPLFDGTPQSVLAQQHIDRMTYFFDLHEIDEENVTMRLFVQTFGGEVRKWFRALQTRSITTLAEL